MRYFYQTAFPSLETGGEIKDRPVFRSTAKRISCIDALSKRAVLQLLEFGSMKYEKLPLGVYGESKQSLLAFQ
jgi:hypothetical protein